MRTIHGLRVAAIVAAGAGVLALGPGRPVEAQTISTGSTAAVVVKDAAGAYLGRLVSVTVAGDNGRGPEFVVVLTSAGYFVSLNPDGTPFATDAPIVFSQPACTGQAHLVVANLTLNGGVVPPTNYRLNTSFASWLAYSSYNGKFLTPLGPGEHADNQPSILGLPNKLSVGCSPSAPASTFAIPVRFMSAVDVGLPEVIKGPLAFK